LPNFSSIQWVVDEFLPAKMMKKSAQKLPKKSPKIAGILVYLPLL